MKKLGAFIMGLCMLAFSWQVALAAEPPSPQSATDRLMEVGNTTTLADKSTLGTTIAGLLKTALGLLGIILAILVIYSGYLWMTAQGNEEQVTKAKKMITNAVIGMILTFSAYAITDFVIKAITGPKA